jgi:hypothetical protein
MFKIQNKKKEMFRYQWGCTTGAFSKFSLREKPKFFQNFSPKNNPLKVNG